MTRLNFGSINLKTWAYTLVLPVIVLSTLIIVGCVSTSPGIPNIYIAELKDTTLRFGYLGVCSSSPNEANFQCTSIVGKTAAALSTTLSAPEVNVQHLLDLQASISFVIPVFSGITFFLGVVTFTTAMSAVNRDSSRLDTYVTATRIFVWASVATALTAAYSVTYTISALVHATVASPTLAISRGKALEILQWMVLGFSALFAISVHKLTQIDDSDILPTAKSASTPAKRSILPPTAAKRAPPPPPARQRKNSL